MFSKHFEYLKRYPRTRPPTLNQKHCLVVHEGLPAAFQPKQHFVALSLSLSQKNHGRGGRRLPSLPHAQVVAGSLWGFPPSGSAVRRDELEGVHPPLWPQLLSFLSSGLGLLFIPSFLPAGPGPGLRMQTRAKRPPPCQAFEGSGFGAFRAMFAPTDCSGFTLAR